MQVCNTVCNLFPSRLVLVFSHVVLCLVRVTITGEYMVIWLNNLTYRQIDMINGIGCHSGVIVYKGLHMHDSEGISVSKAAQVTFERCDKGSRLYSASAKSNHSVIPETKSV